MEQAVRGWNLPNVTLMLELLQLDEEVQQWMCLLLHIDWRFWSFTFVKYYLSVYVCRELAVFWFRQKRLQFNKQTLHVYLAQMPVYLTQAKVQTFMLISKLFLLKLAYSVWRNDLTFSPQFVTYWMWQIVFWREVHVLLLTKCRYNSKLEIKMHQEVQNHENFKFLTNICL